ncbi:histidinol-phosphate transaminase [Salinibius halmophilus]|uniref:histidinol-phosphate transaminase n=1 Tax=Salinibius halmophilus TaxID=1853216 RepID=UPI000E66F309|nr:histidinol-phosphate transaminase [Salinibius halmophilus]
MSKYWSAQVAELKPYVPGEQPKSQNLIKLNTNENPYGPSPKVLEAIAAHCDHRLRLYPEPTSLAVREALAEANGLRPEEVFVGNGSDEVLAHVFQGLLKQNKPLRFPDISYSFYPVYCGLFNVASELVPLKQDYRIDVDAMANNEGPVILPNPNAPTGILLSLAEIERLCLMNVDYAVVIDEAYIDFGGESATTLIAKHPNLLVVQTFSKSKSLAGMRIGAAYGQAHLIEALVRVKDSFNSYPLDMLAQAAAIAATKDQAYYDECNQKVIAARDWLTTELEALGFNVLPSHANFVFARPPAGNAEAVQQALREQSIIVRYFNKPRLNEHLRITIGSQLECEALVNALKQIIH